MDENIELRSYSIRNELTNVKRLEEYHEIKHAERPVESLETFASSLVPELINQYDFFTQMDPKTESKKKPKKKRTKKNDNLMDIISSELASLTIPISETRIEIIEQRKACLDSYVQTFFRDYRSLQRRNPLADQEHGHTQMSRTEKLCPIFPNLLENFTEQLIPPISVSYVYPVPFTDLINDFTQIEADQSAKFLDVTLSDIQFKHHHYFSLEDILCLKLISNYKEYKSVQDTLKELSRDIKVNRETKDILKKDLLKVSPNKKDEISFDATVRKYTCELLQLKEKYWKTLQLEKEICHRIISIWSDIEMIREKFECRSTPYNLSISRQIINKNDYENEWHSLYAEEFTDMLAKIEYDYGTKYIDYKQTKLHQNREGNSNKKLNKPKLNFNEDAIKKKVEELVNNTVKKDKIDFKLEKDKQSISELKLVRNTYCFQIYVDKVFVCESEHYTSIDKWSNVTFRESFSIEILSSNETMDITLLENDETVAQLNVNLSELNRNIIGNYTKVTYIFDKDVRPFPNYVGSGYDIKEIAAVHQVRLKSSNLFQGKLITTCEVNAKIIWNENFNQNQSEAMKASASIGNSIKRLLHGIDKPNVEILTEIIGKIYGKDVSNDQAIINMLNQLCKLEVQEHETFAIDENSAEYVRLKLLHLRKNGGFTEVQTKMIPVHGSQISTEQLNCLQKAKAKDFDIEYLRDKDADMDPIELQRYIAAKYMQKLNKKMLKNLNEHLMVKTQKDVVREFRDFSLRGIFSGGNNMNSLTSIPSGDKQQMLMDSLSKEQNIEISVQRAFNLLDRSTPIDDEEEINEDTIAGYKVRPLRPFVRVSYHGVTAQTVTAMGCHPSWNHTLKLSTTLEPLSNLHINVYDECKVNISDGSDEQSTLERTVHYRYYNKWLGTAQVPLFTVLALGSLRGTFKISSPPLLFGYETGDNRESRSLIPEITQLMKKETSYITLNITTELAHLGGFQAFHQPLPSTVEDDYLIKHLNAFVTSYTNDFPTRNISLTFIDSAGRNKCVTQFLQPLPMPDREFFPKNPKSCGSAMSKSSGVSRSSSSKSSGRRGEVDVEASEEKESVYSQEMNWKGGDGLVRTINACLRYVALIPNYEVKDTHVVTLMGVELLKVLVGSPLDHTLLLAGYFLYLGIKSWVAIGSGLPRGCSSYTLIQYDITARRFVLTTDELFKSRGVLNRSEGYLWYVCDAVSGDRYELRDVASPLKTVYYVFDNENIWVNMQSSQDCENVSFDLYKSSDWQPVFDKNIFVQKQPIVNDSHLYSSPANVDSLRQTLETKIKGKVQKWRSHLKTIWNRYCSGLLRDTLPHWEYWAFNQNGTKPGLSHKLKQLMATYQIFGFPLNIPFTNTKSVLAAVKAAAVHVYDEPTVEFALGVEVYAYPNNVLSVWVFLATITRM